MTNPPRIVTAASLFDGHDAAINVMRRLMQKQGAEVIHLGHNRSVQEVVSAAVEEDAHAVAISSYQGGHVEYFQYLVDLLREAGCSHVKVFGGGGGVILPKEMEALHGYGVTRLYSPEDGRQMGLEGMIADLVGQASYDLLEQGGCDQLIASAEADRPRALARALTAIEDGERSQEAVQEAMERCKRSHSPAPVVGITGTGGAGKSSLTDELVQRFLRASDAGRVAILSIDPTRKKTGGALLGDRIRMNALDGKRTFMRSMATRGSGSELSVATEAALGLLRTAGFDLVLLESSGTGQADSAVLDVADQSLYVMTAEYGAASQLEKIEMLDHADWIAVNKFDRAGSQDAVRDVRKQFRRNHDLLNTIAHPNETLPVFGTIASQFNDAAVSALYNGLAQALPAALPLLEGSFARVSPGRRSVIPEQRVQYLGQVATSVRAYHRWAEKQAEGARELQSLERAAQTLGEVAAEELATAIAAARGRVDEAAWEALAGFREQQAAYAQEQVCYRVRGKDIKVAARVESLSGLGIPRVAVAALPDDGAAMTFVLSEGLPGSFPYAGGVFPFKRVDEFPTRQFAGEGPPERTNRRFHLLCKGSAAHRLSTAFDSPTLYGQDPDPRPDIFGKIGESGVSIATLDHMKSLYAGFDLCDPSTSVSMTINGPAPILLAMFFNTAIDQQVECFRAEQGRAPDAEEQARIQAHTLKTLRGTVQADILKEDQAQNTCIFSVEFALRMMADIQEFLVREGARNYYSVSISGYHIAEAGANPISQLAFTLANGLTYVEAYLARGLSIDEIAPNLSFFFSNGLDPEYTVIGRVARRIWAIAMRDVYGASTSSQRLKYHIQTSGRSLHSMEIDFNDVRTTLQALLALQDNCNSLHTNAYDEAITLPTEHSVRRALAIQLINQLEFGWLKNENPLQGSFYAEWLTREVEGAVLDEFDRLNQRGGVLGAMERQYQRSRIQEESLHYEHLKHAGDLPIVGVNTFLGADSGMASEDDSMEIRRSSEEEKRGQLDSLAAFQEAHSEDAPVALERLSRAALAGENTFDVLMDTVRVASLGQISDTLYRVGGRYRRSM